MNRIGIISININTDDLNYGALLHSFAFQWYLNNVIGLESEIINYTSSSLKDYCFAFPFFDYLEKKNYSQAFLSLFRAIPHIIKYKKFQLFICENMRLSEREYNSDTIDSAVFDYNTVVCVNTGFVLPQNTGQY